MQQSTQQFNALLVLYFLPPVPLAVFVRHTDEVDDAFVHDGSLQQPFFAEFSDETNGR